MNEIIPRKVNKVIVHLHLDELFTLYEARQFGQKAFIGIGQASVCFSKEPIKRQTPAYWAAEETLCAGDGGDISDEHRDGREARLENESAASLMADYLHITDLIIRHMVAEVTYWDTNKKCPKTHLASILKMIRIKYGHDCGVFVQHTLNIIDAVRKYYTEQLEPGPYEDEFEAFCFDYIDKRVENGTFLDGDAVDGLRREIKKKVKQMFGLSTIFLALWRTSKQTKVPKIRMDVSETMGFILDVLYWDQVNYHSMIRDFDALPQQDKIDARFIIPVWDGSRIRNIQAAFIRSKNPQAHNVLRSTFESKVTIVMDFAGNVTVQADQKYAKDHGLLEAFSEGITNLCAMYRYCDTEPKVRKSIAWAILRERGNCYGRGGQLWHLAKADWISMYNGTFNHVAPPTGIHWQQLIEYAQDAFDPVSLERWQAKYGVTKLAEHNVSVEQALKAAAASGDNALQTLGRAMDKSLAHRNN